MVRRIEDAMPTEPWDASEPFDDGVPELDKTPEPGARFDPLAAELSRAKSYAAWTKSLKSFLLPRANIARLELSSAQGMVAAARDGTRVSTAVGAGVA